MCEEISYDEIYMPSELDGGSNGGTRRPSTDAEVETSKPEDEDDREPGEVTEEKMKSGTHPPEEVNLFIYLTVSVTSKKMGSQIDVLCSIL
ncbi:unnamed protein product [Strongylus vulgaris]|uniref:Uncharacterized protein n=1 Tax=Strongylus vulgaris TaxID=40348 RepID=A0A3P7LDY9_STRVU|nr:unnamed protein product [Strongylus vulgaris]